MATPRPRVPRAHKLALELDQDLDDTIRSSPIQGPGPAAAQRPRSGAGAVADCRDCRSWERPGGDPSTRTAAASEGNDPDASIRAALYMEYFGPPRRMGRRPIPGGHQVQPSDKGLLPAPVQRGQKKVPHRVYQAYHPERSSSPGVNLPLTPTEAPNPAP